MTYSKKHLRYLEWLTNKKSLSIIALNGTIVNRWGMVSVMSAQKGRGGAKSERKIAELFAADMHTHSECSQDSECRIDDMRISQEEKGTVIFAVTDHFNSAEWRERDIFSPIEESNEKARKQNEMGEAEVLTGAEIGEAFWEPEAYLKLIEKANMDVLIGSVHQVRYGDLTMPYSRIDFSLLTEDELHGYLNQYFDDVAEMIKSTDFDILAHLTCPLRYITGKYKIRVALDRYDEKINGILSEIIKKEIALEVNTSSYDALSDFMPSCDIIKRYYSMGGYLITLGSDAHEAKNASVHFGDAIKALKEIGFESIFCYKKRTPHRIEI